MKHTYHDFIGFLSNKRLYENQINEFLRERSGKYAEYLVKALQIPGEYVRNFLIHLERQLHVNSITNIEEFYSIYKKADLLEAEELAVSLVGRFHYSKFIILVRVMEEEIYERVIVSTNDFDQPVYETRLKEKYVPLFKYTETVNGEPVDNRREGSKWVEDGKSEKGIMIKNENGELTILNRGEVVINNDGVHSGKKSSAQSVIDEIAKLLKSKGVKF